MSIIITKGGKAPQKPERANIENEKYLQGYICDNPESIPLDEIEENIILLILAREFPTRSGEIDALGIDYDGNIYVIETKLHKNQDKRAVLAQVLDYGASLWFTYEDSDSFIKELEQSVSKIVAESLTERIRKFYETDADTAAEIIQKVRQNLRDGYFRFVVLMDYIEDRLRDLLIFVNQNSRFQIYGVEMEFYKFEEYEIVIPKLYGAGVKKGAGLTRPKKLTRELNAVHKSILKVIDRPLRKNEIMQKLSDAGVSISEKTLQRRLQEAVEWEQLNTPMRGYYEPVQLEADHKETLSNVNSM